jgi:hypothetical protein
MAAGLVAGAAAPLVRTYDYTYGAGSLKNRQIQFTISPAGALTIAVHTIQYPPAGPTVGAAICAVPPAHVSVQKSVVDLRDAMKAPENLNLSQLSADQQRALIESIATRKIRSFTNIPGLPHEHVTGFVIQI